MLMYQLWGIYLVYLFHTGSLEGDVSVFRLDLSTVCSQKVTAEKSVGCLATYGDVVAATFGSKPYCVLMQVRYRNVTGINFFHHFY